MTPFNHPRSKFLISLVAVFIISFLGGLGLFAAVVFGGDTLPEIEQPQTSRFYYQDEELMTTQFVENRTKISLEEVAEEALLAFLAVEDRRFLEHHGFDLAGIARAAYQNLRQGEITQGGSTITQQLAKNLYLSHDRTWWRKLEEAVLTVRLEHRYTKDEILEKYLNTIYFGHSTYGIEEASHLYFDKPAADLSLAEAAVLAGLPQGPGYYSPFIDKEAAHRQQQSVLRLMEEADYITAEERREALLQELNYRESPALPRDSNYLVEQIMNQELEEIAIREPELLHKGGLEVYTTIDPSMQSAAEKIMKEELPARREDQQGVTQPQGALVAMEPDTGKIKALVGGRNFQETPLNRATLKRSPGSAFKPIVYAAALEQKEKDTTYTAASTFRCEPISIPQEGREEPYQPTDFGGGYHHRELSLREALAKSCNITAVKLNKEIGSKNTTAMAEKLGIEGNLDANLSLPLGTSEVTLLEMTTAYAVFANGGYRVTPLLVDKALDYQGEELINHRPQKERVLEDNLAYLVTDLLQGVLQEGGTASAVEDILSRPAAGKTGTSQNYKNVYMVGYTPDLVVGLYIGDDQEEPLEQSGGELAAPLWAKFMEEASRGLPPGDFSRPPDIVEKTLCPETGLAQHEHCTAPPEKEIFLPGTEPQKNCSHQDCPQIEEPPWWHWEFWW